MFGFIWMSNIKIINIKLCLFRPHVLSKRPQSSVSILDGGVAFRRLPPTRPARPSRSLSPWRVDEGRTIQLARAASAAARGWRDSDNNTVCLFMLFIKICHIYSLLVCVARVLVY